jgi:hypothetical protein
MTAEYGARLLSSYHSQRHNGKDTLNNATHRSIYGTPASRAMQDIKTGQLTGRVIELSTFMGRHLHLLARFEDETSLYADCDIP